MSAMATVAAPPEVELTELEATLRRLLLDVAAYIDGQPNVSTSDLPSSLPLSLADEKVELRFTGGWVRDKLLNVPSQDIDVAINKMTGYQFGLRMQEYLNQPGVAEKYHIGSGKHVDGPGSEGSLPATTGLGGLHKIEANPEKSKHLETVTTRILGLDIDLVNLRKETYSTESRNPQMEFGTPEEDALRRDATVNALFYNLNTLSLEDLTGRGLDDMESRILRTPLEPYQTFRDDPLRVLRLIRFASRLNYSIDPRAASAMGDGRIKGALRAKISRERVGTEVEKMLKGRDPRAALAWIDQLALYSTIFTDPTRTLTHTPSTAAWESAYDCAHALLRSGDPSEPTPSSTRAIAALRSTLIRHPEDAYLAWMLAALVPWVTAPMPTPSTSSGKTPPPLAVTVAREGVKANNKVCSVIEGAFKHLGEVQTQKDEIVRSSKGSALSPERIDELTDRATLGMTLRRWGPQWRSYIALAIFVDATAETIGREAVLEDYAAFVGRLKKLDLLEVTSLKPLMDGKQLAQALGLKSGPWMKEGLEQVMAWQLRNPGVQDVQERQAGGILQPSAFPSQLKLDKMPSTCLLDAAVDPGDGLYDNNLQKSESGMGDEDEARPRASVRQRCSHPNEAFEVPEPYPEPYAEPYERADQDDEAARGDLTQAGLADEDGIDPVHGRLPRTEEREAVGR
ncbi:MAG: CCA tRNA nucleotidyltransferase, mitochondrial [Thelocarpon superellum]|nr:MAG: CCA tRNA nucleotidyltransferase, mitochondrial [Thelocarpon superellum]